MTASVTAEHCRTDRSSARKVAMVGGFDAAHIGGSFKRAAPSLGITPVEFDVADAWRGNRIVRALRWRFADRRPPRMTEFSATVATRCADLGVETVIATGPAPLTPETLRELRRSGIRSMNYATDDPWNRLSRCQWFLEALPHYDVVFTPRSANLADLQRLGCADVRYLPFGYDEDLHAPCVDAVHGTGHDVLFVGGADQDRAEFVAEFARHGPALTLVGGYWHRYRIPNTVWLGCKTPQEIRTLTAAAKVNVCLLRRANRDDHVMRTFEIAAIGGGCMLAEESATHRHLFGNDGESATFFTDGREAAVRAAGLLSEPNRMRRLSRNARNRIIEARSSYADRLASILSSSPASSVMVPASCQDCLT